MPIRKAIDDFVCLNGNYETLKGNFSPFLFNHDSVQVELRIDNLIHAIKMLNPDQLSDWCANLEACESVYYSQKDEEKLHFLISELAPPRYSLSNDRENSTV
ncbi:hypothetical protein [Hyphomonas atlantica]|uniref:hypothetical protein n=1 Tax=Hyphomonas atlantica TaxID=1280948 RepID=UPI0012DBD68D|nr:hypothetical protein [Hyphomonas atlantica]